MHIYIFVQHSKLINFDFLINLHALQIYTLQKHDIVSVCSYTQNNSNVFAYTLQLIYIIYTYIAKTWLSFCAFTCSYDAVNQSIFRFIKSMYMHCNHIHCKNMTQSLLIYTERQQHLCAYAATHIHHIHIYCEDTTQLLHIYMLVWCSKLIDFSLYQIDVHASQSYTLRKHDTVFAHIHRTTATSLRMRCNSYTSYTYILWRHNSAMCETYQTAQPISSQKDHLVTKL